MFESKGLKEFFEKCKRAGSGDFKKELIQMLEGLGFDFLRVIEDEILRRKVIDTRLLLASFQKGHSNDIWEFDEGGLTLEVGTNVEYARYVNDGHWTCKKGDAMRFVPGYWNGGKFTYDPSAKTGMMLKQKWVEGAHYWESGLKIMEAMLPGILERKLQEWINIYFGG